MRILQGPLCFKAPVTWHRDICMVLVRLAALQPSKTSIVGLSPAGALVVQKKQLGESQQLVVSLACNLCQHARHTCPQGQRVSLKWLQQAYMHGISSQPSTAHRASAGIHTTRTVTPHALYAFVLVISCLTAP